MSEIGLRILLVSFTSNNRWSGMGKWTHRTAEELTQLNHSTVLWFAEDFPLINRMGRLAVLVYPLALAVRLWQRRQSFDVVVVHEPGGFWYGWLRRLTRSLPPMVLMCHNVESRHFNDLKRAARLGWAVVPRTMKIKTRWLRLWQSDGAIKLSDHIACLSSVDVEYITRNLGRAAVSVTRQVNGVDELEADMREVVRQNRSALFVGGWLDVKGRRLLPFLWRKVRTELLDARLTIVGSGQHAQLVLSEFDERDRESVTVIPRLYEESEMVEQYAKHSLFIMPSLSEGSPLALLEAMMAALPIVAARVGGVQDIVSHGVDGLLFDALNPVEAAAHVCKLWSEPEEAARIGQAARARARLLTWKASTLSLLSAIEKARNPSGINLNTPALPLADFQREAVGPICTEQK